MKKLSLIAVLLLAIVATSCGKKEEESKIDKSLLIGEWKKSDNSYFETFYSDGTGKEWTPIDDITEEEASWFTWEFNEGTDDMFTKYYEMELGGIVPQSCNILELTSTTLRYNNDGYRATYNLVRVE